MAHAGAASCCLGHAGRRRGGRLRQLRSGGSTLSRARSWIRNLPDLPPGPVPGVVGEHARLRHRRSGVSGHEPARAAREQRRPGHVLRELPRAGGRARRSRPTGPTSTGSRARPKASPATSATRSPVTGTHNNPLTLASNGGLFGPFADPVPGSPHNVSYSRLLDGATPDRRTPAGAATTSRICRAPTSSGRSPSGRPPSLSQTPGGESCAQCHMVASDGRRRDHPDKIRRVHDHMFPAVDLAVGDPAPTPRRRIGAAERRPRAAAHGASLHGDPADALRQSGHAQAPADAGQRRRLRTRLAERRHARSPRLGRADRLPGGQRHLRQRQSRARSASSPARCRWKEARPTRTCG